jgi:hypothetical protein
MRRGTALIFGAGATKACGGPLTKEILPRAFELQNFINREEFMPIMDAFLRENFHLPDMGVRTGESYPPLPLLIGLIDIAIYRKHSLGPDWDADKLVRVRQALDYAIFAVIENDLLSLAANYYNKLIERLFSLTQTPPTIVSLNYDIIADNTLMALSEQYGAVGFPDYGCDIATEIYQKQNKFGKLYKLHGSLNWLYCPSCQRLDIGTTESGRRTIKMLDQLYQEEQTLEGGDLYHRYTCHGSPCRDCGTYVAPVMISPTHLKDYRNPHISQVWYQADRALRKASRVVIAGYSMPWDDVDVIYLFKRSLGDLPASAITVVEMDEARRPAREHSVGQNYIKIFGDGIDWHPEGFAEFAVNWQP